MDYKATLNLPKTTFPMKAQLPTREPTMIAHWHETDLYGQMRRAPHPKGRFILHDGPPYANGDIHIGHALNKILKDIIVRYKTLQGFDAPYVPGWDCHGMPIEHQLFKELGITKHQIDQTTFRAKARAYAQRYVELQREQFKRLGVLGDWDHPYLTMDTMYELTILRVFKELVMAGAIYRGKKPVYWCATCETALAEAEVEHENRTDASIFVKFPVVEKPKTLPSDYEPMFQKKVSVIAWTTTPWTLPANVALCFNPNPEVPYAFFRRGEDDGERFIVDKNLGMKLLQESLPLPDRFIFDGEIDGRDLEGMLCRTPYGNRLSRAVTDPGVLRTEGTGIVHIAPGHGQEDYAIGQRYKLEVLSPVDHQGRFTQEVPQFMGQSVFDANRKIIDDLRQRSLLLKEEPITHSYPHCWRCKQPVIFRATPQWFLSMEHDPKHNPLRVRLIDAVKQVRWIPPVGLNRMMGMLETRPDWCLSRQRYWGTPIPILRCVPCQKPLLERSALEEIEKTLQEQGVDAWFMLSPKDLAPHAQCPQDPAHELDKETDILDVWFDSGVSYEAVLKQRPALRWPADLYLEGSDQHRGWFQVSLIPSVALHDQPPYRGVLTHGFVVDGDGRKMSKSLGNVVAPQEVMQRYGADILRLWVASCDYREDVRLSDPILNQVAESYRKIRNTFRYLLANLYDFNPREHTVPQSAYPTIDRWMLDRTEAMRCAVTEAYEAYQFHEVFRTVYQYCVVELSAFYLDALKDRLYTEAATSVKRRCAQSTVYAILHTLVKILAPVLAVTTEEVWQQMREAGWVSEPSVHLASWPSDLAVVLSPTERAHVERFLSMRDVVMKALEEQRLKQVIGSPLEAEVTLRVHDDATRQAWTSSEELLAEMFVVSRVRVEANHGATPPLDPAIPELVDVAVARAPGGKCIRCWRYTRSVGQDLAHPQLCDRCARVVTSP